MTKEKIAFTVNTFARKGNSIDFANSNYDRTKLEGTPAIYILENPQRTKFYIGQTHNIERRLKNHFNNPDKKIFRKATVFFHPEFDDTVLNDFENRLIVLFLAHEITLTNGNFGNARPSYNNRDHFSLIFRAFWELLKKKDFVSKNISELETTEIYRLSPKGSLAQDQEKVQEEILRKVPQYLKDEKTLIVQGAPGTGKTYLAVSLLHKLKTHPKTKHLNIKLVFPLPPLRQSYKNIVRNIDGMDPEDIVGPTQLVPNGMEFDETDKPYDIILVDEAHRLAKYNNISYRGRFKTVSETLGLNHETCNQVDWIRKVAKMPIFFFDPLQDVRPSSPTFEEFENSFGEAIRNPLFLTDQKRVKGGDQYIDFIQNLLAGRNPVTPELSDYSLEFYDDFNDFHDSFEHYLSMNRLTRLVAGYAWPWKSNQEGEDFDILLGDHQLKWNTDLDTWIESGFDDESIAHEVGCIHKVQGYDLSHAFVIIGNDIIYDEETQTFKANRDNYFDKYGKQNTEDDQLNAYIRKIYYILLTRGIDSTHVYVVNPETRKHFRKFFNTIHEKGFKREELIELPEEQEDDWFVEEENFEAEEPAIEQLKMDWGEL